MCGFFLSKINKINYQKELLIKKFNNIKHRGTDSSNFLEIEKGDNYFLGHHRLTINDLSDKSNQPFSSDCKQVYLLFNGEIFNFNDLKKKLDYNFKTTSDTEVILAGYTIHGVNFFKELEGFFSIVVLDFNKNKIISCIDPLSVKNLYYKVDNNEVSLSSELSCLEPSLDKTNFNYQLCNEALELYFQYGYIHAPFTIYKNIFKLEPGELIEVDTLKNRINKTKNFLSIYKIDDSKISNIEIIHNAHLSRLVSDVPIAHFLSAGIDSTLSNLIYSEHKPNEIETYTLGLLDKSLDESSLAIDQSQKLSIKKKNVLKVSEKDITDEFIKFTNYVDEPFGDSSAILVSLLSEHISKKYKVAISSDGGDELLYGYSRHRFFMAFSWLLLIPKQIRFKISRLINTRLTLKILKFFRSNHSEIKINKILSFMNSNSINESYLQLLKLIPQSSVMSILNKSYNLKDLELPSDFKTKSELIKFVDYKYYIPSINFKNDRCGMRYGLEIREPLLNHFLIKKFLKNSFTFKDFVNPKNLFRKILSENSIIIKKKKHGFSFSQSRLLSYNNFQLVNDLKKDIQFFDKIINYKNTNFYIKEFKISGKYSTELWLIANFVFWLKGKIF